MTIFFNFDTLTWPDVAALPRTTPLIIPLGIGYNHSVLSDSLHNPDKIGLLPPLPFGWAGSLLAVDEQIMIDLLNNLLNSLQDDGFTNVYALTPQGVCLNLDARRIAQSLATRLSLSPRIPSEKDCEKVVVIPIGHTEQHSLHLPLNTDTIIIDAIATGVQDHAFEKAVTLPSMPYGVSTHRAAFAGTMNAGGRVFEDFWLSVIDNLVRRNFTRLYLISGHGGNCSFLTNVVKYAGERYYQAFIATSWLYLSGPRGVQSLQQNRQSDIGGMGHAGELETSLMLHLRPEWVHMDLVVDETSFITTPSYYMDWVEGGALIANPPWEDDVQEGAYGAGSLGTAEKGAVWMKDAIEEKITHIDEIQEQYQRRMARRQDINNKSSPQSFQRI